MARASRGFPHIELNNKNTSETALATVPLEKEMRKK
jgi:hypothetical protein